MTDQLPSNPDVNRDVLPLRQNTGGVDEPLRPELYQYVRLERGPADMRTFLLNHPLLSVEIENFNSCQVIHSQINDATDELEEAIDENRWRDVIYRHDERYRVRAFCEYAHLLSDQDYWTILGDIYRGYQAEGTLPDAFPEVLILHKLLQCGRLYREFLMDEGDREIYRRLPPKFTIYRGFTRGDGSGISWTLDRKIAVFFAWREFALSDGKYPIRVRTAVVRDKSLVYAYFGKEAEILVPMEGLSLLSTKEIGNESGVHPTKVSFDFDAWLAGCLPATEQA
jgi:hypothetical protein